MRRCPHGFRQPLVERKRWKIASATQIRDFYLHSHALQTRPVRLGMYTEQQRSLRCACKCAEDSNAGSGVLDRPSTSEVPKQDRATKAQNATGPDYIVYLHDDSVNRREFVVRVLLKVVDSLSMDEAVNIMQTAHEHGLSVVCVVPQSVRDNGTVAMPPQTCALFVCSFSPFTFNSTDWRLCCVPAMCTTHQLAEEYTEGLRENGLTSTVCAHSEALPL